MDQILAGIGKRERFQLATVLKSNAAIITPVGAAAALKITRSRAAQLLSLWTRKGWLSRVKRAVYIPVPLQAESPEIMADEPWILAKNLFAPCYIGGWSAAEYWDFTEQIFSSTMVFTTRKVAKRELKLKGVSFTLKTVKSERLFGATAIWLQNQKIEISDPSKTIVDAFNDPTTVGGIRMAMDMLSRYLSSEHKNLDLLSVYATSMGNSAIYKRLGFIFETKYPGEKPFIEKCRSSLRSGYSQFDPASPGKSLVTSWKLWVVSAWKEGLHDHS